PPRAHHDPRGDGARVLRALPRPRRVGRSDEVLPLHDAPGEPLRPLGSRDLRRARFDPPRPDGPRRQACRADGRGRSARDLGGQAPALPRSRAARRVVCARVPLAHGGHPRSMTTGSNLLAFLGLVITLLIVWRQSWPARLRLFVAQSLLLAALASTIGVLAQRRGLLLVAAVFV